MQSQKNGGGPGAQLINMQSLSDSRFEMSMLYEQSPVRKDIKVSVSWKELFRITSIIILGKQ